MGKATWSACWKCRASWVFPIACPVYLSPVFGRLDPARIVDFMQDNNLIWATAQLQLHKIIWPGVEKGV